MHHYGEDAVQAFVDQKSFRIVATNHVTGAKITMEGPTLGVLASKEKVVGKPFVENFAREFAHFLRRTLNEFPGAKGAQ